MWDDEEHDHDDDDDFDPEKERKRVEALPIYQKAEEIYELTQRIVDSIDSDKVRMIHSNIMLEDSIVITTKIVGAEAMDDFILKMENATLVKIHARSLQTHTASLIFEGILPEEYLQLLRKEIEAFRLLFREWIKGFHSAHKSGDGWGMFVDDDGADF